MAGEIKKFLIEAYRSAEYDGGPVDSYEVLYNPEKYTLKYEILFQDAQGRGTSGSAQVFDKMKPREFNFEFMLDATGVSGVSTDIEFEVDWFLRVCYKLDGDIHRPRYLKLSWGTLISKCVLKSADVTYTLFKPDATPIRAKINATFSENIEDTRRAAEERKSSPDLTHYRQIKDGDRLPIMAYKMYRDKNYYIQLARANKLTNFRNLQTGDTLIFPPVINNNNNG
ncbi:MAG: hypothetical protein PVH88_02390 [Ignavibacteria bacterium]|jgi:hypothetical protein